MRSPFRYAMFKAAGACCVVAAAIAFAGCGSDAHHTDGGANMDADFNLCEGTPAVTYEQGMTVTSTSGAYVATLVSAVTESNPTIQGFALDKHNVWVVSVTDAVSGTPADVMLTAQRPTMPLHTHGSPDMPVVTPGEPGTFTITMLNFFMAGYWEFKLDLQPATGAADRVTFAICVPS